MGWHEWVTKEGSQPLDDDFDLATYDARDVNEVLISQAIPEFIGWDVFFLTHLNRCNSSSSIIWISEYINR